MQNVRQIQIDKIVGKGEYRCIEGIRKKNCFKTTDYDLFYKTTRNRPLPLICVVRTKTANRTNIKMKNKETMWKERKGDVI